MGNNIEYAKKFLPVIDDIYKAQSITQVMDAGTQADFSGTNEVRVLKVSTTGLGDYSRVSGYPKGDVAASWETLQLSEERGKEFSIDRMDNEETLGLAFGKLTGNFMRDWVTPELDAYRFAKYASTAGISAAAPASLTKDTVIQAIDEAVRQMDADEVPEDGRILFVSYDLKPLLNGAVNRAFGNESVVNTVLSGYNNMNIVYVPKSRFYTAITLNDGVAASGYAKAAGAKDINFMLVYPESVLQVTKFALPKIFDPDVNQDKDMWKFQFRLYHDAFVYENKVKGIYLHTK